MENSTIFDDVFKTLLEKCRSLIIPVINEVFKTDYSMKEAVMLWSNELVGADEEGRSQKRTADSIIEIRQKTYHIECQSTDDNEMELRMVEYDFRIASDRRRKNENGEWILPFPKSAVIYLRQTPRTPKELRVRLILPDETEAAYQIPAVRLQEYSKEEIFDKQLLFFLPYYILRFENELGEIAQDEARFMDFREDYADIYGRLKRLQEREIIDILYLNDLVELIKRLVEYVAKDNESVKEVSRMGGKVLELESDRLLRKGREEGIKITLMALYRDGIIDFDTLVMRMNMTEEEVLNKLAEQDPTQTTNERKR